MTTETEHQPHADHPHVHGPGCGHVAFEHDDHIDYAHDSHVHRAHGDHDRSESRVLWRIIVEGDRPVLM